MTRLRIWAITLAIMMTGGPAMAEEFDTMQRWCIGRYGVDIPSGFSLRDQSGSLPAVEIADLGPATAHDAKAQLARRRAALSLGLETDEEGAQLLFTEERQTGAGLVLAAQRRFPELDYTSDIWREELTVLRHGHLLQITALMSQEGADAARAEMDLVAGAARPLAAGEAPASGVCLPGVMLDLPRISGAWSMIFMPDGVEGPVGLKLYIVERAPSLPPLDPAGQFNAADARPVRIAGLPGQELRRVDPFISFGAVAAAAPATDGWGVDITVEYFDERPDAGASPLTPETAAAIWDRVLSSIGPRG